MKPPKPKPPAHPQPPSTAPSPSSVFAFNLPPRNPAEWLQDTFAEFGKISSITIPQKHKSSGRTYGFIHFSRPEEACSAIASLNGSVYPQGRLIVANARGALVHMSSCNLKQQDTIQRLSPPTHSYLEAVTSNLPVPQPVVRSKQVFECIGAPNFSITRKLDFSIIAIGRSNIDIEVILNQMVEDNILDASISSLGNRVHLIAFDTQESFNRSKHDNWSRFNRWFIDYQINPLFIKRGGIFQWISITGLPPVCWSMNSIKNIADLAGEIVFIHPDCISGHHYDRALVLVHTRSLDPIGMDVAITVMEKRYTVRLSNFDSAGVPISLLELHPYVTHPIGSSSSDSGSSSSAWEEADVGSEDGEFRPPANCPPLADDPSAGVCVSSFSATEMSPSEDDQMDVERGVRDLPAVCSSGNRLRFLFRK